MLAVRHIVLSAVDPGGVEQSHAATSKHCLAPAAYITQAGWKALSVP